jgi:tRNA(Ile)-lysidine synthase TilS/MesJ
MDASVLPLSWPADFDPLDHKRFETDARTLRYQALGRACRRERITSLLVAHHADDQAETILMRLAKNRLRSGLQAMHPVEWIPECFGIHGVSHSGARLPSLKNPSLAHMPFSVEKGGVRILRPLLGFEKSQLIATCEESDVAWAEDKTNHIQTYTSRNAIRHMLRNHALPTALSVRALSDVSLHMQKRIKRHKAQAKKLMDQCLMKLDLQTGSLLIRFPPFEDLVEQPIWTRADINEAKNNAYYLLERVSQLVTPRESAPLSELASTIANVWPEFEDFEETHSSPVGSKTKYCVYSIWWRKWERVSPFFKPSTKSGGKKVIHDREWLLTRQPLDKPSNRPKPCPNTLTYPPSRTHPPTQDNPFTWQNDPDTSNPFQLFDGRWWIRIQNNTTSPLTLRFFDEADIHHLQSPPHSGRHLASVLSRLKPADLRFTLPALFQLDSATGEETLIGFPTLNVSMARFGFPGDVCAWQVRYKKIDLDTARLGEIVVSNFTHLQPKKEVVRSAGSRAGGTRNGIQQRQNAMREDRTSLLTPVTESKRQGRSEKRGGGGYTIKWEDVKD